MEAAAEHRGVIVGRRCSTGDEGGVQAAGTCRRRHITARVDFAIGLIELVHVIERRAGIIEIMGNMGDWAGVINDTVVVVER